MEKIFNLKLKKSRIITLITFLKKIGKVNELNIDIEGKDFERIKSSCSDIIDLAVIFIKNYDYFSSKKLIELNSLGRMN